VIPAPRAAASLAVTLVAALIVFLAARPPALVHFDAAGPAGDFLGEGWSESIRTDLDPDVGALDPAAAGFNRFRIRAASPGAEIALPLAAREGALRLRVHALARVRTAVAFHVAGTPGDEIIVPKAPWADYDVEIPASTDAAAWRRSSPCGPSPSCASPDEFMAHPVVWMGDMEASAPSGLVLSTGARATLAATTLAVFAFAMLVGAGWSAAAVAALAAAAGILVARTWSRFPFSS
jgi:hypothetical protein